MTVKRHQDEVDLKVTFEQAHDWLQRKGETNLSTRAGTMFTAQATRT